MPLSPGQAPNADDVWQSLETNAMLDVLNRDPARRIGVIVRNFVKGGAPDGGVGADQNLEDLGLTSMDMVNLMLAVEAEFDVTIPGARLIPANFRSIQRIAALVEELTQ
jgi:acyl carrier protein